jgi:hypothetical protein
VKMSQLAIFVSAKRDNIPLSLLSEHTQGVEGSDLSGLNMAR